MSDKEVIIQRMTQKILQHETGELDNKAELTRLLDIEKQFHMLSLNNKELIEAKDEL